MWFSVIIGYPIYWGDIMSTIAPQLREKFESLPIDLKNAILERDIQLNTMNDLIHILEEIVKEGT